MISVFSTWQKWLEIKRRNVGVRVVYTDRLYQSALRRGNVFGVDRGVESEATDSDLRVKLPLELHAYARK